MPELAEVEQSRRTWDPGIGQAVRKVIVRRPEGRIYREVDTSALVRNLRGRKLVTSEARGKQMLFCFEGGSWLGIHLGMRGDLRLEPRADSYQPRKHDYLALEMSNGSVLIFEDLRLFGRVRYEKSEAEPEWWAKLPPAVISPAFTRSVMEHFLQRRKRAPIKAVLLMQERFPVVGNWMADETLWRARLHPAIRAGELTAAEIQRLYKAVRWVCEKSITTMDADWHYPASWLFSHRWEAGGTCPRCKTPLDRGTIGGRTTAWCPECQPAKSGPEDPLERKRKPGRQRRAD